MNELPFTIEQFLELFEVYNRAIWPAQLIAYLLAGSALFLVIRKETASDTFINLILGTFWIWMGVVYHILFFSGINPAAVQLTIYEDMGLVIAGITSVIMLVYRNRKQMEFKMYDTV